MFCRSGSPDMEDIEAFSKAYQERLNEAEIAGSIPDISLEVLPLHIIYRLHNGWVWQVGQRVKTGKCLRQIQTNWIEQRKTVVLETRGCNFESHLPIGNVNEDESYKIENKKNYTGTAYKQMND